MYYMMGWSGGQYPRRRISGYPDFDVWWDDGFRFEVELPDPIEIEMSPLNENSPEQSSYMPEYFPGEIPLFCDELVGALHKVGVFNFDVYNVALKDPDNGQVYSSYKAVNVIGLIEAADMEKFRASVPDNNPLIDVGFDELVIDETKVRGVEMFRLAENCSDIFVSERLRDFLKEEGFRKIMFYKPDEVVL